MKALIAMFQWTGHPDWEPYAGTERQRGNDSNFTRATEYVEVDFPELPADAIRDIQIERLRAQRKAYEREQDRRSTLHADDIARIDAQIAALSPSAPSSGEGESPGR